MVSGAPRPEVLVPYSGSAATCTSPTALYGRRWTKVPSTWAGSRVTAPCIRSQGLDPEPDEVEKPDEVETPEAVESGVTRGTPVAGSLLTEIGHS